MAEKRMFTMKIVDTDAFLDMPMSSQCLYFHLNMRADDDGFVHNPKKVARMIGASEDDLKLLLLKRFVLSFPDNSGVIVIKHWRMHNTIQADRYKPTVYQEQLKTLTVKTNKSYTDSTLDTPCIQDASTMETECIQSDSTGLGLDLDKGLDKGLGLDKSINAYTFFTGYPTELIEAVTDWIEYKKEKRQAYKPTGLKSFLTQMKNKADELGSDAVIASINRSMASNYQGVFFDKVQQSREPLPF